MFRSLLTSLVGVTVLALPAASPDSTGPVPVLPGGGEHRGSSEIDLSGEAFPCVSNMGRPNGDGIISQDFEDELDSWDAIGGADFTLEAKCRLGSIYVDGYEDGVNFPAPDAVHWAIYTSTKSRQPVPDKLVRGCYSTVRLNGTDTDLEFDVPLRCTLSAGVRYWLTIQPKLDSSAGAWYWATTSQRVGAKDVWKNPGDGLLSGCVTWGPIGCIGAQYDSDEYRFSLRRYGS